MGTNHSIHGGYVRTTGWHQETERWVVRPVGDRRPSTPRGSTRRETVPPCTLCRAGAVRVQQIIGVEEEEALRVRLAILRDTATTSEHDSRRGLGEWHQVKGFVQRLPRLATAFEAESDVGSPLSSCRSLTPSPPGLTPSPHYSQSPAHAVHGGGFASNSRRSQ